MAPLRLESDVGGTGEASYPREAYMTIGELTKYIREHFESGRTTSADWDEMVQALVSANGTQWDGRAPCKDIADDEGQPPIAAVIGVLWAGASSHEE